MNEFLKKLGYVQGLISGLDIDESSKEGKIFAAIIDTLESLSEAMEEMNDTIEDIDESVEQLTDDLTELEDQFDDLDEIVEEKTKETIYDCFQDLAEKMDDDDDDELDFPKLHFNGDNDDEDEDDEEYEIECPACEHTFTVSESVLFSGKTRCPECNEKIGIDIDNCDCGGCGHKHNDD